MQSLPRAPHIRNDFSDLGIQAPNQAGAAVAGADNLDNISVISATAAVQVQQTQVCFEKPLFPKPLVTSQIPRPQTNDKS